MSPLITKPGKLAALPKKTKYGAEKVTIGSVTFDSKAEGRRYYQLKKDPRVVSIEINPAFILMPGFRKCVPCAKIFENETITRCPVCRKPLLAFRPIGYTADFRVLYKDGAVEIEDVKGVETRDFQMRRKMFERAYPNLTLQVVRMK